MHHPQTRIHPQSQIQRLQMRKWVNAPLTSSRLLMTCILSLEKAVWTRIAAGVLEATGQDVTEEQCRLKWINLKRT